MHNAIERSINSQDATEVIAACARFTSASGTFGSQTGQIDTLVLGCTHYPFASPHLLQLLGPGVQIVDNGMAVARQTRRLMASQRFGAGNADSATTVTGHVRLLTTGQPHVLQAAAARLLGLESPVETL